MLHNMTYNRSKRVYEVGTGDGIETFPAGVDGKRVAFRTAVHAQSPRLFQFTTQMIDQSPAIESRAWRAAELVLSGGVLGGFDGTNIIAKVASSNEYGDYLIREDDGMLSCECHDFQNIAAPYDQTEQAICKHIAAVKLAQRLAVHCETAVH